MQRRWNLVFAALVLTLWLLSLFNVVLDRRLVEKKLEEARADVAANEKNLMVLKEEIVALKLRVSSLERKPKPEMEKEKKRKGPLRKFLERE